MENTNTQQAIIGYVLSDFTDGFDGIMESGVAPSDFTGECKTIWMEIEKAYAENIPITQLKISDRLGAGFWDIVGDCCENGCLDSDLQYNLDSLKRETLIRRSYDIILNAQDNIQTANCDNIEQIVADLQKDVINLHIEKPNDKPMHEHMGEFVEKCKEGTVGVVPWFFPALNRRCGKLVEEFIVVHAQPSVGKTAFIVQWATYLRRNGFNPAIVTLESPKKSLAQRFISHMGQVNTLFMKTGSSHPDDYMKAGRATREAEELGFNIRDGMNYESETRKFMEISLSVKRIRDHIGIPVVLLHHSNEDGRVGWAKDIEKDVDYLIYLERKDNTTGDKMCDNIDFVFQKGRDAGTFTLNTLFKKDMQTYHETEMER